MAAKVVTSGHMRVNGTKIKKTSFAVGPGDTLTFPQARAVRVIRIRDIGTRRGPAPEAQMLYEDLSPPKPKEPRMEQISKTPGSDGKGRPTKKDRRTLDLYKG